MTPYAVIDPLARPDAQIIARFSRHGDAEQWAASKNRADAPGTRGAYYVDYRR